MALSKAELACDNVLNSLKVSRLTFSIQETPYSCYVTIRKKFSINPFGEVSSLSPVLENLKSPATCERFENLSKENSSLKLQLEDALREKKEISETLECMKKVGDKKVSVNNAVASETKQIREENKRLETELESAEKEWKRLNKILKQTEKKVYDLSKENNKVKEDLEIEKAALNNFRAQVNKERKDMEKRNKKIEKNEVLNNLKEESKPNQFECKKCDNTYISEEKLKTHNLEQHTRTTFSQTDVVISVDKKLQVKNSDLDKNKKDFDKYECFYCGKTIVSEQELKHHVVNCPGPHTTNDFQVNKALPINVNVAHQKPSHPNISSDSLPFVLLPITPRSSLLKCEQCGWFELSETHLKNHKKVCTMKYGVYSLNY